MSLRASHLWPLYGWELAATPRCIWDARAVVCVCVCDIMSCVTLNVTIFHLRLCSLRGAVGLK